MRKPATISLLALLIFLAAPGAAATAAGVPAAIPVASVCGGDNTDPGLPLRHLHDGDPGTVWATRDTSPAEAWFVLELEARTVIDYLETHGAPAGEASLQYADADGIWQPFLGRQRFALTGGRLDLSYSRALTDKLRFVLHNPGSAARLGPIGEIEVFGHAPGTIAPLKGTVTASGEAPGYPAAFLTDKNTKTVWRAPAGHNAASVPAVLPRTATVSAVKLFTRRGAGLLEVSACVNGGWQTAAQGIDLSASDGWRTVPLPDLAASAIRIDLADSGAGYVGGLAEVEIWGKEDTETRKTILLGEDLTGPNALGFTLDGPAAWDEAALWLSLPAGGIETPAGISLNGRTIAAAWEEVSLYGTALVKANLPPAYLRSGRNVLSLDPGSAAAAEAVLVLGKTGGCLPAAIPGLPGLCDGGRYAGASYAAESLEIELAAPASVDGIGLYGYAPPRPVSLFVHSDGGWVAVDPALLRFDGETIRIEGGTPAILRLKLQAAPDFIAALTEVELKGSPVTDGPPAITIIAPAAESVINPNERLTAEGYVDDTEAAVTVDGTPVTLDGHRFNLTKKIQPVANQFVRTVAVAATDLQGRTSRAERVYYLHKAPDLTCDLPEETPTKDDAVTVTGKAKDAKTVKVNGAIAALRGQNYTCRVLLTEGENLLTIEAVSQKETVTRLSRRVIRDTQAPSVRLAWPAHGMAVTRPDLTVRGSVQDVTDTAIAVNGNPARMSGNAFTAALTLNPGPNTIAVSARDAVGNESILTVAVTYAPMTLELAGPAEGALLNTASVRVAGRVVGAWPAKLTVNGTVVTPDPDGTFACAVIMPDGSGTVTVTAAGQDGYRISETRRVTVDTMPPAPFSVTVTPVGQYTEWIDENRPVFAFATTDATSGVKEYHIRLDGGAWTGPVASPCQFAEALADGEHTVAVRAVDEAGWERVVACTVKIDTVAPPVPVDFESVSGDSKAILLWGPDLDEPVITYRIRRNGGTPVEIPGPAAEYADLNLTSSC